MKKLSSKENFLLALVIQVPNVGLDLPLVDLGSMVERQLFVVFIPPL
jgi:hypothetical protein